MAFSKKRIDELAQLNLKAGQQIEDSLKTVQQEIVAVDKEFGKSREFRDLDRAVGFMFVEFGETLHDCVAAYEEKNPKADMVQLLGKLFMIQIKLAS